MAMGHEGSPSADVRVATGGVKVDGSRARVRRARVRVGRKGGVGGAVCCPVCEFEVRVVVVRVVARVVLRRVVVVRVVVRVGIVSCEHEGEEKFYFRRVLHSGEARPYDQEGDGLPRLCRGAAGSDALSLGRAAAAVLPRRAWRKPWACRIRKTSTAYLGFAGLRARTI